MSGNFDAIVIGAGIVGVAHALAAARCGKRVALIEGTSHPVGASIRNFGFVTVTGQERAEMWRLARRSRDRWVEVASIADITVLQTGLMVLARRAEAVTILEEFLDTEMGEECRLASPGEVARLAPDAPFQPFQTALISPHEVRVEARDVMPRLVRWLASRWRVSVFPDTTVMALEPGKVVTTGNTFTADNIFVCPGDQLVSLFPKLAEEMGVQRCKLQMLRLAAPEYRLPSPIMSDLGLARYEGYTALPTAKALHARLQQEQGAEMAAGVHLIAAQSLDGSLVVGDSHDYDDPLNPFQRSDIDELILGEFGKVLGTVPVVTERWIGTYAWSADRNWFSREILPGVFVSMVTCGAGMSTAFAIGEDVVSNALNVSLEGCIQ